MIAFVGVASFSFGQAQKYLNVGGLGTGLYGSIEFPVSSVKSVSNLKCASNVWALKLLKANTPKGRRAQKPK